MLTLTIKIADSETQGQEVIEISTTGATDNLTCREDMIGRLLIAYLKQVADTLAGCKPFVTSGPPSNG